MEVTRHYYFSMPEFNTRSGRLVGRMKEVSGASWCFASDPTLEYTWLSCKGETKGGYKFSIQVEAQKLSVTFDVDENRRGVLARERYEMDLLANDAMKELGCVQLLNSATLKDPANVFEQGLWDTLEPGFVRLIMSTVCTRNDSMDSSDRARMDWLLRDSERTPTDFPDFFTEEPNETNASYKILGWHYFPRAYFLPLANDVEGLLDADAIFYLNSHVHASLTPQASIALLADMSLSDSTFERSKMSMILHHRAGHCRILPVLNKSGIAYVPSSDGQSWLQLPDPELILRWHEVDLKMGGRLRILARILKRLDRRVFGGRFNSLQMEMLVANYIQQGRQSTGLLDLLTDFLRWSTPILGDEGFSKSKLATSLGQLGPSVGEEVSLLASAFENILTEIKDANTDLLPHWLYKLG